MNNVYPERMLCLLKQKAPLILSAAACIGVIATAVESIRATPKAMTVIKTESEKKYGNEKDYTVKDAVKWAWKEYIPTALYAGATIACICGAGFGAERKQRALISAYAVLSNSFGRYKETLIDLYGEEADKRIRSTIATEKVDSEHIIYTTGAYTSMIDFGISTDPDTVRTFYEPFSDRYFESTNAKVFEALYHLNRNFLFEGTISLNEFYSLLGVEPTEYGNAVGWSNTNGDIYWIDFNNYMTVTADGMEICVIDPVFEPTADYLADL